MSSNAITPLPIDVNDDLAKAVASATSPEALRAAVQSEFDKQVSAAVNKAQADAAAATQAAADKAAADAKVAVTTPEDTLISRTEVIGGKEIEFTGGSDAELDRAVLNAYKVYEATRSTEPAVTVDPAVAQAAAEKAAADQAAARVELELQFKRGDITAADFIERSGAVKEYLEKQGVPIEELRASVEQNRGQKEIQSWESATNEFLQGPVGADWPGESGTSTSSV